jgi:orotate phosphoribosyltransferase
LDTAQKIAGLLLKIKAVELRPDNPFTWASGMKSPIYCDNRKTLSYPEIRTMIRDEFVKMIREKYQEVEVIAGVATGAIAQGVLVADALEKSFIYVRSESKSHGLENQVEGVLYGGQKVIVIEDLVSTGGSSLKAVEAIHKAGGEVLSLLAIFSYNLTRATDSFKEKKCSLITLSNYDTLIDIAFQSGYISKNDLNLLKRWRENPDTWLLK